MRASADGPSRLQGIQDIWSKTLHRMAPSLVLVAIPQLGSGRSRSVP